MGLFIGFVFGVLGFFFVAKANLLNTLMRAAKVAFATTTIAGVTGYFYGRFYLAKTGVSWWLPDNLQHPADFITVGSIHNFGYAGGLLGLLSGTICIFQHRRLAQTKLPVQAAG